jgi:hypothetical protein
MAARRTEETMAEPKTRPTKERVSDFLARIADERRRRDCQTVHDIMAETTGAPAEMWGASIVGFGRYRQRYADGREMEWPVAAFSPRKTDLTLYLVEGFDRYPELTRRLGTFRTGKVCLYLKRLEDVDVGVLRELVAWSVERMADRRVDRSRPA